MSLCNRLSTVFFTALVFGLHGAALVHAQPNVIVIVADDIGWHDLGYAGATDILTPNIDTLAGQGVKFTNAYSSAPVCSPSRAGIMTGRYQNRFGHETNPGTTLEHNPAFGLPATESTFGARFKALGLGYATGWVGKSHLGWRDPNNPGNWSPYHPNDRGFDEFYGFLESHHDYLNANAEPKYHDDPIQYNGTKTPVAGTTYLTTKFADRAVQFINANAANPFLLYVAFNAAHFPLDEHQHDAYHSRFDVLPPGQRPTGTRLELASAIAGLDDAVLAIMNAVSSNLLDQKTLIFFTTDNGGDISSRSAANNLPLRGGKTQVYEGGIRVPFLMRWTNHLPAGATFDAPVSGIDILPTAIAATGASIPAAWQLDGVDLIPYILGQKAGVPHPSLFWRVETNGVTISEDGTDIPDGLRAVRSGQWKLVKPGVSAAWELYDFNTEAGRAERESPSANVADQYPEVVRSLVAEYEAWSGQNERPLWAAFDLEYASPAHIIDDMRIGSAAVSYLGADFLPGGEHVAFRDGNGTLWRGGFDPLNGWFIFADGKDQQIDVNLGSSFGGPNWALSSAGPSLFYPKLGAFSHQQIWRARLTPGVTLDQRTASQLNDSHHARVSQETADASARFVFQVGGNTWWADEANPLGVQQITTHAGGADNGQWIPGTQDLAIVQSAGSQIARYRTATGVTEPISADGGGKSDAWGFIAPEFSNELCYAALVDHTSIAVYRDADPAASGTWPRIATLTLPANSPPRYLYSLRPLQGARGFNGMSWFTCSAFENDDPLNPGASEVWLLGLGPDANHRAAFRLDVSGGGSHLNPQTVVGTNDVFGFYTRSDGVNPVQLRRVATPLSRPEWRGAPSGFTTLPFAGSFSADANPTVSATETTNLATHGGALFAAFGSRGADANNVSFTGAQIFKKTDANSSWQVDASLAEHSSVEVMESIYFAAPNVSLLVAAFSDVNPLGEFIVGTRTRIGSVGGSATWVHEMIPAATGPAHPISLGTHIDQTPTPVQNVFVGTSNGEIHRGKYDAGHASLINWAAGVGETPNPELSGVGPVTGFVNCNGSIYAACGITPTGDGGLYRRDDTTHAWSLVYRWPTPLPLASAAVTDRLMTGITLADDPRGSENDVILAARSWPGVIERVELANDHAVIVELDVRDFFARRWNDDSIRTAATRIGYNSFTRATDPITGEDVHLIGLWIERPPANTPPHNGSHFLIRHHDGTYEAADIEGPAIVVPGGQSLRATRCIAVSPFAQDAGRTFYFGGYDATGSTNESDKAWIISSAWSQLPALTISQPNPPAVQLSWPATGLDWQLETNTDLGLSSAWQPVSAKPTRSIMGTTQSIDAAGSAGFFRLRKP